MAKRMVYKGQGYDIYKDAQPISEHWATEEFLNRHNLKKVEDSGLLVDESELDGDGRYIR